MLLNRTNSYIFTRCAVKRYQYHWNISKHMSRTFTFYLAVSGVLFAQLTPALFYNRNLFKTPFKHLRWSVFASTANYFKLLAVCAKHSILDAWRGSEYACVQIESNNILCHHNKRLMGYFEFLYGLEIICLPLIIPEKLHWQHLFQNPVKAEIHPLYFS